MQMRRSLLYTPLSIAFLCLVALFASFVGSVDISLSDIWQDEEARRIWLLLRAPRIMLAVLVGAGLAVCGAAMQSLFKNPMAEANLLGISAGAALCAGLAIVFSLHHSLIGQPLLAFLGAAATVYLVFWLAHHHGRTHITALLLAGIAMNAIAGAAIGLLLFVSDDQALRSLTFWMMGSIRLLNWPELLLVAVVVIGGILRLCMLAPALDMLAVGTTQARMAGVNTERLTRELILIIALISGVVTAFCGIIGFVGIVIPHIIRLTFGATHHTLLLASAWLGAVFLLLADSVARSLIAPAELPIGILTGLVGGPFFLLLLYGYVKRGAT